MVIKSIKYIWCKVVIHTANYLYLNKVSSIFCVYQKNWLWHYYVWANVFMNSCCDWHILVHARRHSLTLQCVESSQGDGADKLLSIWSPNVPHDPFSSDTVSAWSRLLLIWTGFMYSQSSKVPRSRDKYKYGNQGRCDTSAMPGKWQQVSKDMAWTSQICHLVWGMLVDSWDNTSEALFVLYFFYCWAKFPMEAAFDCRD